MAVKYGSGPRPAAHTAKRCFLNCLETSLRPSIRPPSCTASKAPLKGRSRRAKTPWQSGPIRTSLPLVFWLCETGPLSGALLAVQEGGRMEGLRLVSRQFRKATFGSMGCRLRARSVLHCHGVLALRDRPLSGALLAVQEGG